MVTAREAIKDILHPIRHNDLEARRRRLKLSRVALARILDVDPATVYRQERSVMSALWDYAMRGIEAEAKSWASKAFVRDQQAKVARQAMIPDAVAERGFGYTAEKMKAVKRRPKVAKPMPAGSQKEGPVPTGESPRSRMPLPSLAEIKAVADRAEERSRKNRRL